MTALATTPSEAYESLRHVHMELVFAALFLLAILAVWIMAVCRAGSRDLPPAPVRGDRLYVIQGGVCELGDVAEAAIWQWVHADDRDAA